MANNKMTAKQKASKVQAAEERARRVQEAKERKARTKKIFTVVVCVILVLALCIPTMALALLGGR